MFISQWKFKIHSSFDIFLRNKCFDIMRCMAYRVKPVIGANKANRIKCEAPLLTHLLKFQKQVK